MKTETEIDNTPEMRHFIRRMGAQTMFTAPELSAVMGVSVNCVYALSDEGKIGYCDLGTKSRRRYVYPRESVINYLRKICNRI